MPCRSDFFAIILSSFTRGTGLVIAAARDDSRMELSETAVAIARVTGYMLLMSSIRRNRNASQALTRPMMIASRGSGITSSAIARNTRVFTYAVVVPSAAG